MAGNHTGLKPVGYTATARKRALFAVKSPSGDAVSDIEIALEAIGFMESHLTDDIAVRDVAEAVSLSLYHFSRTFSRTTRHSPYDYLTRRRLIEEASLLLDGRCCYGIAFCSPSHPTSRHMYLAGESLEQGEAVPQTLVQKHLPAAKYARMEEKRASQLSKAM